MRRGQPEGATVLATGDGVHLQGFRIRDRAWGTQFHLEVDQHEMDLWLQSAGEDVIRAWGKTTGELRDETSRYLPAQERRAREVFRRFGEVCRTRSADGRLDV